MPKLENLDNLFDVNNYQSILNRIDQIVPDRNPNWGKMNAAQMMAHCIRTFEMATGQKKLGRSFLGKLIGRFIKKKYVSNEPFGKNSPTHPYFLIRDLRNFEAEKTNLKNIMKQFHEGGAEKCTTLPHSFFGFLTPDEWALAMYKHMDHHLRQFEDPKN